MGTEDNLLRDHADDGHVDLEDSNQYLDQGYGKDDDQRYEYEDAHEKEAM